MAASMALPVKALSTLGSSGQSQQASVVRMSLLIGCLVCYVCCMCYGLTFKFHVHSAGGLTALLLITGSRCQLACQCLGAAPSARRGRVWAGAAPRTDMAYDLAPAAS